MAPKSGGTKSTGGRPTTERVGEISERILLAAGAAFARLGGQLSLDDVALDAQVSKQAIYRRYSGKAELIGAVIERGLNAILASADDPVPDAPIEALRHWAWRIFVNNSAPTSADFGRHLYGMTMESAEVSEALRNWERRLLEPIDAALHRLQAANGMRDGDVETAGRILYDLVVTGARRVSDAYRGQSPSDADRRRAFEPRWQTFVSLLTP